MLTTNRKKAKRYSFHHSFREAESRASTPSGGVKGKLFGLPRLCQTETSHRAQRLTAAHKKTSTMRAFLRKNKQKSCRYFTNTHELGTIKRNVISVIMCTQTERAQTSNVTRFARDGVGPFDCMCLCVCAGLNLTLFPPEKDRSR